ncbi:MAG: hypothetical protein CMG64_02775 [Candidatus Marinimicrobia bacterium]|nr:hypothetical protein [Candidatus Neomarinimicrobiota bacterium]
MFIYRLLFFLLVSSFVYMETHSVSIDVLEQNQDFVILHYTINDYDISNISINDENFNKIVLDGEPNLLIQGHPELPHVNRSLIIPDNKSSRIEIISYEYSLINNMDIVPSKGNIKRNIDINSIPYEKGFIYDKNAFFPSNLAELHNPYILRDFRGQVVQFNPFQFNPVTQELKVYENMIIKIHFDGTNAMNLYLNRNENKKLIFDYNNLYMDHFLNYNTYQTRYNPISEDGEMLVICYDSFCDEMQDFVDWKNQSGIKTTLVPKSDAGNNASSIGNYVESFYNSHDLTYLLLVGDKTQIPTFDIGNGWSSGESDISYAYISGNDSYPEFFVGRFAAQNTGHVQTQVQRTIEYELSPQMNADWYTRGLMIASNEGAGNGHDGGESDWEHAQNMRDDLLDYTYTDIDEMYDGSHGGEDSSGPPSDTMVKNAINSGLGIIHYTGHGDTDVWVTSNFNTGDVNALTNTNELPFICTVGCKSGDFGGTCLGEVFTYATHNNEPTGAIATFMSTIYQSWAPPMEAQDEMVDILVENYSNNRKYTFGGISWNGCLKMNDAYGSDGATETNHWTLFGDPSVSIRTEAPMTISINHSGQYDPNDGAYEVILDNAYDNVKATLSNDGQILGTAYGEGNFAVVVLEEDVSNLDSMTLTITGYNIVPVVESVQLGESCPGYSLGDLNGDSQTNVSDIVMLVNIILGVSSPDECQEEYSDLNGDGNQNVSDVVMLVNLILGN